MKLIYVLGLLSVATIGKAQSEVFKTGPVFTEFGAHAPVEVTSPVNNQASFKIAFDVAQKAELGKRNRAMESAARFMNMHVANGVNKSSIELAVIVHGQAVKDLLKTSNSQTNSAQNQMIKSMLAQNIKFIVCGQSATYYEVAREDLISGVEMSLSAMTAHALLQQQGYTLNPF